MEGERKACGAAPLCVSFLSFSPRLSIQFRWSNIMHAWEKTGPLDNFIAFHRNDWMPFDTCRKLGNYYITRNVKSYKSIKFQFYTWILENISMPCKIFCFFALCFVLFIKLFYQSKKEYGMFFFRANHFGKILSTDVCLYLACNMTWNMYFLKRAIVNRNKEQ